MQVPAYFVFALVVTAATIAQPDARPASLLRIENARSAWRTGRIEVLFHKGADGGTNICDYRFSPGEQLEINRGDEDGVIGRYEDGAVQPYGYGPQYTLVTENKTWEFTEGHLRADVRAPGNVTPHVIDMRSLGLTPTPPYRDLSLSLWEDKVAMASPRKYDTKRTGAIETVTAQTDLGVMTWELDHGKGGLPTKVSLDSTGGELFEAHVQLDKFNEEWYPRRIEYFATRYENGRRPYETTDIFAAEFNQPDQPRRLTPATINIDAGVNLIMFDAEGKPDNRVFVWDGEKPALGAEFSARVRTGEAQRGPIFLKNVERARVLSQYDQMHRDQMAQDKRAAAPLKRWESDWERYVREFIARYRLDAEQVQKAELHLRAAEGSAREFLQRHDGDVKTLETKQSEADKAAGEARKPLLEQAAAMQEKLTAGIGAIFESQLKNKLERLPTREQRKLVEQPTTTRPRK